MVSLNATRPDPVRSADGLIRVVSISALAIARLSCLIIANNSVKQNCVNVTIMMCVKHGDL